MKGVFSRFTSLFSMLKKQNLVGGGVCSRSRRDWDQILLGSPLGYPCLAQLQHLLVGEDKDFTELTVPLGLDGRQIFIARNKEYA